MGRVGFVGDELGSVLIAARLVRDVMRLSFLMERVYTPYPKWFGTAFSHLTSAPLLTPHLSRTLKVETWQERQQSLAAAYELLAAHHNTLGLTEPLATHTRLFFDRPFLVLDAGRFCQALVARISDPAVKGIATNGLEGSFDQFSDNTDLLNHTHLWKHI